MDAIKAGNDLGCSRIFIRRYLVEKEGQVDNRYMKRRLNIFLKKQVECGALLCEKNLFRIA